MRPCVLKSAGHIFPSALELVLKYQTCQSERTQKAGGFVMVIGSNLFRRRRGDKSVHRLASLRLWVARRSQRIPGLPVNTEADVRSLKQSSLPSVSAGLPFGKLGLLSSSASSFHRLPYWCCPP